MRRPALPSSRVIIVLVLVLAAYLVVRFVGITADPPTRLPNGTQAVELLIEPVAKAHEARNRALFGTFHTNPADNYQFWRIQSPVWVYPLSWWFRALGVSYLTLRTFSVLVNAAGFLVFIAAAARRLRGVPLWGAGLFFGFNCYQIAYTRVGLLEPAVNTLVIVTAFFVLRAERRPAWLGAALVSWAAAFLTKQTAVFFLPVLLLAGGWVYFKGIRRGEGTRLDRVLPPLALALVFGGLFLYCSQPEYIQRASWNVGHVIVGWAPHKKVAADVVPWVEILTRPFGLERWTKGYLLLFPVAGTLAFLAAVVIGVRLLRRRASLWEALVWLWWGAALGAVLTARPQGNRFELIVYPPVALLGGEALVILQRYLVRRDLPRAARAIALALCLGAAVHDGAYYTYWVTHRRYTAQQVNKDVAKAIGRRDAVVIGLWAGPSVFNTKYVYYYVKDDFNATKDALVALGVTHFLLFDSSDYTRGILTRHYPKLMKSIEKQKSFTILRSKISLYKLEEPLR